MIGYAESQDLVDYAEARGVTIDIADAPVLLTKALDWLELQPIKFDDDPVPDGIVKAQLAAALIYHEGGDPLAAIQPRVTQEMVMGAVSVSYSDRGPLVTLYPILRGLIAPFMDPASGGANTFKVLRG